MRNCASGNLEIPGSCFACPGMTIASSWKYPPKKKGQLSLAQYGDKLSANRPDPDDPGGLGAKESGVERTGPTQDCLVAIQKGGRWAEIGPYYDSSNDPVTRFWTIGRA